MSALTRRRVLGGTAAALAGAALATPAVADSLTRPASDGAGAHTGHAGHAAPAGHGHGGPAPEPFDEVYRGRRIQGMAAGHGGGGHHHGAGYTVLVDGRELHTMRNADSTWISVVNHYETFATPRALARAAVEELQGAQLVPFG
ncbi:apotyrosinase chaperone MelC1 [Streptomyces sp. URMC 123]|uniref:apotyrosinase chaperone MelC1 n=1 Tax=Streptomyces sp. URMC 123 TaxID=3423403 RepID=UPI003F1A5FB3